MLGRSQRGHAAEIVASVLVDRVVGVYFLFAFLTVAILTNRFEQTPDQTIGVVCQAVFAITAAGALGIAAVLLPGAFGERVVRTAGRLPRVGRLLARVISDVRLYRRRLRTLALCSGLTLIIHGLSAVGYYLIGAGLGGAIPPLSAHLLIVPLGILAAIIPIPIGPPEFVVEYLYARWPAGAAAAGHGLVVALLARFGGLIGSVVGLVFSLAVFRAGPATSETAPATKPHVAIEPDMQLRSSPVTERPSPLLTD
jgi:hypothetical protein